MKDLTAADLVTQIAQLDRSRTYEYISGRSRLKIEEVHLPEGPISFSNIKKDGSLDRQANITKQSLAKMAAVCSTKPNYPLHMDRIFSAGGNTRSAFETLLVYTPHFFVCHPQRFEVFSSEIVTNLKHVMWCPDDTHPQGERASKTFNDIISEIEHGIDFGRIHIAPSQFGDEFDIEAKRTHTQMQIALLRIGNALRFQTWIANNDRGIQVENTKLGNLDGVISSLKNVDLFYKTDIKDKASLVDCIWFTSDLDEIPAVLEIEHSTGVTSGLTRMSKLKEAFPSISTTFTIVAPDHLRDKVVTEANQRIFRRLDARFMSYSAVRELYGLMQSYPLADFVEPKFVQAFMEKVVK